MSTNSITDGGPAFPCLDIVERDVTGRLKGHEISGAGLSMRDYFAAKAMQGFAADPDCSWPDGVDGMARTSYQWSDAMIKARGV